jgi:hypothetical protein
MVPYRLIILLGGGGWHPDSLPKILVNPLTIAYEHFACSVWLRACITVNMLKGECHMILSDQMILV